FEDAQAARADEVAVFGSASEGFSRANVNAGVDEALERFATVIAAARAIDLPVRGYVSCVVECPYDGAVAPAAVARVADRLFAMGCYEISLGDTLGRASPEGIARMLMAVRDVVPVGRLAGHYHDTGGQALSNIDASLSLGVRAFDASGGVQRVVLVGPVQRDRGDAARIGFNIYRHDECPPRRPRAKSAASFTTCRSSPVA
ncbi:MAG: hypothetical protein AAFR44_16895, partial [Pseudomonadota bacterium]